MFAGSGSKWHGGWLLYGRCQSTDITLYTPPLRQAQGPGGFGKTGSCYGMTGFWFRDGGGRLSHGPSTGSGNGIVWNDRDFCLQRDFSKGSIQMRGRDWRGGAAVPEEWSGLGPAEPRKAHTLGTGASFTEHLYDQESAAKKNKKNCKFKSYLKMGAGSSHLFFLDI